MSSRTVVESPQFAEARADVALDVRRLDEILEGIVWALERDPRRFPQVRGTRLHRIMTDPFPDAPAVRVWYTYNILTQEVHLLSIQTVDDDGRVPQVALHLAAIGGGPVGHTGPDPAA